MGVHLYNLCISCTLDNIFLFFIQPLVFCTSGSVTCPRDIYSNKLELLVKVDCRNMVKLLVYNGKEQEY
jgi:hypothetical protein